MMIWIILKDDGSVTVTSKEENAVMYTQASVVNGEHFKVIPYDEKNNNDSYYTF